jgi:tetratricopeptide (TPR) repeat protein
LEPELRARFAEALGGVAYWQSDRDAALRWYDVALAVWRQKDDKRELANALYNRAYTDVIQVMSGLTLDPELFARTRGMLNEALELYRAAGDKGGEGNILWALGSVEFFSRDLAAAGDWYRQALDLHRQTGQRTMAAWSLHMGSLVAIGNRDYPEGTRLAREALTDFAESGDVSGIILTLDDLAVIAAGLEEGQRSGRLWGAARHLQQTTGTALADYVEETYTMFDSPTPAQLLSADELKAAAAEGAAMSLDELVAYALEVEPATPGQS